MSSPSKKSGLSMDKYTPTNPNHRIVVNVPSPVVGDERDIAEDKLSVEEGGERVVVSAVGGDTEEVVSACVAVTEGENGERGGVATGVAIDGIVSGKVAEEDEGLSVLPTEVAEIDGGGRVGVGVAKGAEVGATVAGVVGLGMRDDVVGLPEFGATVARVAGTDEGVGVALGEEATEGVVAKVTGNVLEVPGVKVTWGAAPVGPAGGTLQSVVENGENALDSPPGNQRFFQREELWLKERPVADPSHSREWGRD